MTTVVAFVADDIVVETEKAVLLRVKNRQAWFPKSVVTIRSGPSGFNVTHGDCFKPLWLLAEEEREER